MDDLREISDALNLGRLDALPHDASTRRYYRSKRGILMVDHGEDFEARLDNFVDIAQRMKRADIRVPELYEWDSARGYAFMEDLGQRALKDVMSDDVLRQGFLNLEKLAKVQADGLKLYTQEIYREESSRLMRFYLEPLSVYDGEILEIADDKFEELASKSNHFVHLDYHAENILVLEDGRLALIDFQDARQGHKLYDLVSYVDAERAPISNALKAEFTRHLSVEERVEFEAISAQRLMKIMGIFARLTSEGREKYARLLPEIYLLLEARLQSIELKLWYEWFKDVVPEPRAGLIDRLRERHD